MIKKFYRVIGDELSLNFNDKGVLASAQLKVDKQINVVTSYFPKLKENSSCTYALAFGFFTRDSIKVPEGLFEFWQWLIKHDMNIHFIMNVVDSTVAVEVIKNEDRNIPCPKLLATVYFDLEKNRITEFGKRYDLDAYAKISKYPK